MPAVWQQNMQSLFFDILSISCPCIITDASYKKYNQIVQFNCV